MSNKKMPQQLKLKMKESRSSGDSSTTAAHNSKQKFEKISKYFTKPQAELSINSPFKNTLSDIEHNNQTSDDSDFKTPEAENKCPKPFQGGKAKIVPKKRLRQKKISSLIKSAEENFSYENVNSEHLQMALALSKSISENTKDNNEEIYNAMYPSTQEKRSELKRTLEEFGFRSGSSRTFQKTFNINRRRKKSKFQYITPILFMRTEEERQSIIASKMTLILNDIKPESVLKICTTCRVSNEYLQKFVSDDNKILTLNSLEVGDLNSEKFYVKNLNLSPTSVRCGSLLKDWSLIPGRETTPPRETNCSDKDEECCITTKSQERTLLVAEEKAESHDVLFAKCRSTSPDLFESDVETNSSSIMEDGLSQATQIQENADVSDEKKNLEIEEDARSAFLNTVEETTKKLLLIEMKKTSLDSGMCDENQDTFTNNSIDKQNVLKVQKYYKENNVNLECSSDISDVSLLSFKRNSSGNELIQTEKGFLHFEGFCKESNVLSQDYVDLTQSSDEERNVDDNKINRSFELLQEIKNNLNDRNKDEISSEIFENPVINEENYFEHKNDETGKFACVSVLEETFRRESLNVTDYIHNILNENQDDLCASDDEVTELSQKSEKQVINIQNNKQQIQTFKKHPSSISITSVNSEEDIYISDEELNYSSVQANISDMSDTEKEIFDAQSDSDYELIEEENRGACTPEPEFVVRTTNVTPVPNFNRMNTPEVINELQKIGVKAMKRKRGVQLLKYIYDATHPLVGEHVQVHEEKISKKRRIVEDKSRSCTEIVGDIINESEDLIFEKRQSTRIHSCRLPLQIAFHNFLSCNPEVKEKILLYEPLQLEELYFQFKNQGFKYDIKDLLTFFDRKCITVRTNKK